MVRRGGFKSAANNTTALVITTYPIALAQPCALTIYARPTASPAALVLQLCWHRHSPQSLTFILKQAT